jgi:hypothetical protein
LLGTKERSLLSESEKNKTFFLKIEKIAFKSDRNNGKYVDITVDILESQSKIGPYLILMLPMNFRRQMELF